MLFKVVLRNRLGGSLGAFRGCFAQSLGHQTSFYAKIYIILKAIEFAVTKGWNFIWLIVTCLKF